MIVEPRLLRTRAAARYLNCSLWQLRRLIWSGALSVIQHGEGGERAPWLLDRADLDLYIEAQKRGR